MTKIAKEWGDGDSLHIEYDGYDDGTITIASDVAEGLDRELEVVVKGAAHDITVTRVVRQSGRRQRFVCADGVFRLASGGSFNVLK